MSVCFVCIGAFKMHIHKVLGNWSRIHIALYNKCVYVCECCSRLLFWYLYFTSHVPKSNHSFSLEFRVLIWCSVYENCLCKCSLQTKRMWLLFIFKWCSKYVPSHYFSKFLFLLFEFVLLFCPLFLSKTTK